MKTLIKNSFLTLIFLSFSACGIKMITPDGPYYQMGAPGSPPVAELETPSAETCQMVLAADSKAGQLGRCVATSAPLPYGAKVYHEFWQQTLPFKTRTKEGCEAFVQRMLKKPEYKLKQACTPL